MRRYTNEQLTSAEVIARLVELAKEVAAEDDRGTSFDPPLSDDALAFYDAVATAALYVDLVAERGPLLGEPYTRQPDGKLRDLRFHRDGRAVRVTYWIASGRRTVLLTVFVKSRMRERAEVARARRATARCMEQEHEAEDDDG